MTLRKCSKEDCPPRSTSRELTVFCHRCGGLIHLPCYGIDRKAVDIFVTGNILMYCDECLANDNDEPARKRKGSVTNLVQSSLASNLSLTIPSTIESPLRTNATVKLTTQKLLESMQLELQTNTQTLSALKSSVDSMHGTVSQQKVAGSDLNGLNSDDITSIKTSLSEIKQSYSNVLKSSLNRNGNETPKSSRTKRASESSKASTPANFGTSKNLIGKPLSPRQSRPKMQRKTSEKAIWISGLHRNTTVEEVLLYAKDNFGVAEVDKLDIRKLVKRGVDLSEYSFVSFKIGCPANMFEMLMDKSKWPSTIRVREFEMETNQSQGTILKVNSPSKNEIMPENQAVPQQDPGMETA